MNEINIKRRVIKFRLKDAVDSISLIIDVVPPLYDTDTISFEIFYIDSCDGERKFIGTFYSCDVRNMLSVMKDIYNNHLGE
jgi:hypothetical protein